MRYSAIKLLMVEDNPGDVGLIREMLLERGIGISEIQTAENLATADRLLAEGNVDVILLDLSLPDSTGIATLEHFVCSGVQQAPIIVLTGNSDEQLGLKAIECGAEDFLTKGTFESQHLIRSIRYAVERWKSEQSLRESEELFKNLFRYHSAIKFIIDPSTGAIVDANEAAAKFYGWSIEALRQMNIGQINIHPIEEVQQTIEKVRSSKQLHFEFRHRRADGSIREIETYSSTITAHGKELLHSIVHDITDRKQAEAATKRLAAIIERSQNEIYLFDQETLKFKYVNQGALKNLQYTSEEIQNLTPLNFKPLFNENSFRQLIAPLVNNEQEILTFQTVHQRHDKSLYPVEVHLQLIDDGSQRVFLAVVFDISERKKTEGVNERLLSAIAQVGESVLITDIKGNIEYANPAAEKIAGYTKEEVIGANPRIFSSGEQDREFYRNLWSTILAGKTWKGRLRNRRKDGSLYTESATISPVFDPKGEIVNFVAVKRDISEYLKLEAQFQQAQKMESIGRLAGGVAHDFNNMLGAILGFTELALDKIDQDSPIRDDLKEVLDAAERSALITRQLLAFARKQTIAPQILNLNDNIKNILKMLQRLIGEDIRLVWRPAGDLWRVRIDPSQIDQILANLCVNARDAISGVGTIIIETSNVFLNEINFIHHFGFTPGNYVLVEISDTGCGIPKELLDHIFEPFFTTKEVGKGTGLGLAMIYGIIKQNNGFISVYSEPGCGTSFKIYFPSCASESISPVKEKSKESKQGVGETILIVEDEAAILRLTEKILSKAGYTVLAASSPGAAITLARENKTKIQLLISDAIMPEMNGRDLAQLLNTMIPNLKFLLMSGYTTNAISAQGMLDHGTNFIQKPFSSDGLLVKVRELLEA